MTTLPRDEAGPQMAALFRSIFHGLALPFTPEGSQRLQEQQIREVCNRFYDLRSDRKVWDPATASQGSEMQPIPGATTDVPDAASDEDSVDDFEDVPTTEGVRHVFYF